MLPVLLAVVPLQAAIAVEVPTSPVLEEVQPTPYLAQVATDWSDNLVSYSNQVGQQISLYCEPNGTLYPVWGSGVYTTNSSVCSAAVHAGIIRPSMGGQVNIEITTWQNGHRGVTRNGVSSLDWESSDTSFVFIGNRPTNYISDWSDNATAYRGQTGQRVFVTCAPNGSLGSVWGTGTYTDDSSICSAAVHAGLIDTEQGGNVMIEIAQGEIAYEGTSQHGITSSEWGRWEGSFVFVEN
ncbi:MAG: LCCL domain-containing protein [Cyanobacteria bacterium P01_A01_bin.123]